MTDILARLVSEAQAVVDAVTQDDCGQLIGQIWMGGNGGMLSRETLKHTDKLRKTLIELTRLRELGAFNIEFLEAIKAEERK